MRSNLPLLLPCRLHLVAAPAQRRGVTWHKKSLWWTMITHAALLSVLALFAALTLFVTVLFPPLLAVSILPPGLTYAFPPRLQTA
jgi:anti-sigma-K factor RskA